LNIVKKHQKSSNAEEKTALAAHDEILNKIQNEQNTWKHEQGEKMKKQEKLLQEMKEEQKNMKEMLNNIVAMLKSKSEAGDATK
jgi:uncharacterized protein YlxW (UPF0749 family)